MSWSLKQAMDRLGLHKTNFKESDIMLILLQGANVDNVHGYNKGSAIAVNPHSEFAAAAGFHELGHAVLMHTMRNRAVSDRDECLAEMEACATSILCLRELGGSGIEPMREQYKHHRDIWVVHEEALPADFKERVNWAARRIIDAGRTV